MAYYLKWKDSGAQGEMIAITGIVGVLASISIKVKTNAVAIGGDARYMYDIRRSDATSTADAGGASYFYESGGNGFLDTTGTSNHRINGVVPASARDLFTSYVADDVLSFDVGLTPSNGAIAIGGNHSEGASLYGFSIAEMVITDGNGAHTINMSDSGGTGTSLTSTDAALTATLNGFPGDNTQWVSYAPPATLTVTQTELTPGGTISGTYADYDTVPTTLTVSDGTNTITIANPGIVDDAAGGGTFSGTMPALPTTGTANLALFGDVTVELS